MPVDKPDPSLSDIQRSISKSKNVKNIFMNISEIIG